MHRARRPRVNRSAHIPSHIPLLLNRLYVEDPGEQTASTTTYTHHARDRVGDGGHQLSSAIITPAPVHEGRAPPEKRARGCPLMSLKQSSCAHGELNAAEYITYARYTWCRRYIRSVVLRGKMVAIGINGTGFSLYAGYSICAE
ncbi:hypothetical protein DFH09DRAFT_1077898 [Mycena vulgaris]|nr:hypothetical protein DFH09DRAFT_1077898 [Mycena vulgaris]